MLMFPLRYTSIQNFRTMCSACRIDGKISNKCCCWETAPFCLKTMHKFDFRIFSILKAFWISRGHIIWNVDITSAKKRTHSMNLEWNLEIWSMPSDYPAFSHNSIESMLWEGNTPLFAVKGVPIAERFECTETGN